MKKAFFLMIIVVMQLLSAPSFSIDRSASVSNSVMPQNSDYSRWDWENQDANNWKRYNPDNGSWTNIQPPFLASTARMGNMVMVCQKKDYTKAKGWRLLWAQFDSRHPYFILYNTHRSLVRVFFYLENQPYSHVLATLKYYSENVYSPGVLSMGNNSGYAYSTDYYYNNNINDDIISVIVKVGANCWCSADFDILLDDNIRDNKYKNKYWEFAFYGCKDYNIYLSSTNEELDDQFSFTTNKSIGVGKFEAKYSKVDKSIKSVESYVNKMQESVKKIDSSAPEFLQDYKKKVENAKTAKSAVSAISSVSSFVGVVISFVNVFKGIVGDSENATVATNSVQQPISLSGTMNIAELLGGNTLLIPGVQNTYSNKLQWNPFNCPMGVINLKTTPSIKVTTPYLKTGRDEPTTNSGGGMLILGDIDYTYDKKYDGKTRKYKFDDNITLVQQKLAGLELKDTKVAIVCKPNGTGNKLYRVDDKYLCRYNYYDLAGRRSQIPTTNPVYKALAEGRFVIHKYDVANNEVYFGTPYMSAEELRGVVFEVPEDTDVKLAVATMFKSDYYDEPIVFKVIYNFNEVEEKAKLSEIGGTLEQTNFLFSEYYNVPFSLILNKKNSKNNEAVNISLVNGFEGVPGFTAKALPLTKGLRNGKLTIESVDFKCTESNRKYMHSIQLDNNEEITGEDLTSNDSYLNIYPNPASDIVNIVSSERMTQIMIYDINGLMLYKKADVSSNMTSVVLDECQSGIYIIVIHDEMGKIHKEQLIINR